MFQAVIIRNQFSAKQTIGRFLLSDGNSIIFEAHSLELPFLRNICFRSSIPPGTYDVVLMQSPKFGMTFHVLNVPGRSHILIHAGNHYTQIRGCVLLGSALAHLNSDGLIDVINSRNTISKLKQLTNHFTLQIISL